MQGNIEDRTSRLNSQMRRDLAAEVEALTVDPTDNNSEELIAELNQTLDDSRALLNQLEENERFLDTRIKSYQRLIGELESRSDAIINTDLSLEENTTLSSVLTDRRQKQKECTQMLQGVIHKHKCLLADIILQKRRVEYLERTRDDLIVKKRECKEFVEASKRIDAQEQVSNQEHSSDIEMASVT